jgi:hypothetical protein
MNEDLHATKDQDIPTDRGRRQLGAGLLAVLGGGLGVTGLAQAFPRSSAGEFNAASRILSRYGVSVNGAFDGTVAPGHDALTIEVVPQPMTEYRQVVGPRNRIGVIIPCIRTSVFGDDASFTHFHPGEIVPCVRTAIEGDDRAIHELFDASDDPSDGAIVPCVRVESTMLDGGRLGPIVVSVDPDEDFSVQVGSRTYILVAGKLVESRPDDEMPR